MDFSKGVGEKLVDVMLAMTCKLESSNGVDPVPQNRIVAVLLPYLECQILECVTKKRGPLLPLHMVPELS